MRGTEKRKVIYRPPLKLTNTHTETCTQMTYRLGVDIGGTFTDFALLNDMSGQLAIHKQLTTPEDPARAVLDGIRSLLGREGVAGAAVNAVVHGTTLVTNAIIERKGARTGIITDRGLFRRARYAGRETLRRFDLRIVFPEPLVPRRRRAEISERCRYDG